MAKLIDLTGQTFGYNTVIAYAGSRPGNGGAMWSCLCICGTTKIISGDFLRRDLIRSCGCRQREKRNYGQNVTHGHTRKYSPSTEYRTWISMKTRCENTNDPNYVRYGGRGIKICERWRDSFENFLQDMGQRPAGNFSIERIDNDGDYGPENCRWATKREQCNNRRSNIWVEWQGRKQNITQWANELGFLPKNLWRRFNRGWTTERALTTPF